MQVRAHQCTVPQNISPVVQQALSHARGCRLPFYGVLKIGFFLWLWLPYTRGAHTLYLSFILPELKRHSARIDNVLEASTLTLNRQMAQLVRSPA